MILTKWILSDKHHIPDDVIAGILFYIDGNIFTANESKIHTTIAILKNEFPEILDIFAFSTRDVYPFSRKLEKVFTRLQISKIIIANPPDYNQYLITEEAKENIKQDILPYFSKKEKKRIKEIADIFYEKCRI